MTRRRRPKLVQQDCLQTGGTFACEKEKILANQKIEEEARSLSEKKIKIDAELENLNEKIEQFEIFCDGFGNKTDLNEPSGDVCCCLLLLPVVAVTQRQQRHRHIFV